MIRVELIQVDLSDSGPAGLHPVQPLLIWRILIERKGDSDCGISQERGCIYSQCSLFKEPSSTEYFWLVQLQPPHFFFVLSGFLILHPQ